MYHYYSKVPNQTKTKSFGLVMFLSLCLHLFDKTNDIVNYYCNLKEMFYMLMYFKMSFISVLAKLNFCRGHYSSL